MIGVGKSRTAVGKLAAPRCIDSYQSAHIVENGLFVRATTSSNEPGFTTMVETGKYVPEILRHENVKMISGIQSVRSVHAGQEGAPPRKVRSRNTSARKREEDDFWNPKRNGRKPVTPLISRLNVSDTSPCIHCLSLN